jgi:hypothetical protein
MDEVKKKIPLTDKEYAEYIGRAKAFSTRK